MAKQLYDGTYKNRAYISERQLKDVEPDFWSQVMSNIGTGISYNNSTLTNVLMAGMAIYAFKKFTDSYKQQQRIEAQRQKEIEDNLHQEQAAAEYKEFVRQNREKFDKSFFGTKDQTGYTSFDVANAMFSNEDFKSKTYEGLNKKTKSEFDEWKADTAQHAVNYTDCFAKHGSDAGFTGCHFYDADGNEIKVDISDVEGKNVGETVAKRVAKSNVMESAVFDGLDRGTIRCVYPDGSEFNRNEINDSYRDKWSEEKINEMSKINGKIISERYEFFRNANADYMKSLAPEDLNLSDEQKNMFTQELVVLSAAEKFKSDMQVEMGMSEMSDFVLKQSGAKRFCNEKSPDMQNQTDDVIYAGMKDDSENSFDDFVADAEYHEVPKAEKKASKKHSEYEKVIREAMQRGEKVEENAKAHESEASYAGFQKGMV